jgi:transcriptional regulator with XRE-family HTH domain
MLSPMNDHLKDAQAATRGLIAKNLMALRQGKGLSQEALAAKAGVHRTQISFLERGLANVTLDNLTTLAVMLEVPVVEFFSESRKESEPLPRGRRVKVGQSVSDQAAAERDVGEHQDE